MFITKQAHLPPRGPEGHGRHGGAAVSRRDGAGADGCSRRPRRRRSCGSSASRWCTASAGSTAYRRQKNLWSPAAVGREFDLTPDQPRAARAVPRLPHDRQQHRRAQRRGVHAAGDRRRSLPIERGVPDAVASEADAGRRTCTRARRSTRSTRSSSARTRRFRRCSCASRTSIRPAAAPTATRASTPTRSAGRRRRSRCR